MRICICVCVCVYVVRACICICALVRLRAFTYIHMRLENTRECSGDDCWKIIGISGVAHSYFLMAAFSAIALAYYYRPTLPGLLYILNVYGNNKERLDKVKFRRQVFIR